MKKLIDDIKKRNYGDAIERITKATGIKKVVDKISEATGVDCGCEARRDAWNLGEKSDDKGNGETSNTGF